jgi:hypothetical protein
MCNLEALPTVCRVNRASVVMCRSSRRSTRGVGPTKGGHVPSREPIATSGRVMFGDRLPDGAENLEEPLRCGANHQHHHVTENTCLKLKIFEKLDFHQVLGLFLAR